MQITNINVVKSDKLYDLNFTLQDSDSVVINLTGATISLKVQKEQTTALKFTGSMSIVSAVAGTCKYTVQATDFDEVGKYQAEIEVTIGTQIVTYTGIIINVLSDLPRT